MIEFVDIMQAGGTGLMGWVVFELRSLRQDIAKIIERVAILEVNHRRKP